MRESEIGKKGMSEGNEAERKGERRTNREREKGKDKEEKRDRERKIE